MKLFIFNKESLIFEPVKITSLIKVIFSTFILSIIIGWTIIPEPVILSNKQEEKLIVIREYNEFTKEKLVIQIKSLNFKFPHIVYAQSKLETKNFTSSIFKSNHNLFGMKQAKQRSNLAIDTQKGHAYYDNWKTSVYDFALFYSTYLYDIKTEGEYFEYLRQNYAEDPLYVEKLQQIIKKENLKNKF
jgi:hypothetical protein